MSQKKLSDSLLSKGTTSESKIQVQKRFRHIKQGSSESLRQKNFLRLVALHHTWWMESHSALIIYSPSGHESEHRALKAARLQHEEDDGGY